MQLFEWQTRAVNDSAACEGWGLFARPGTGKTLAALTIAERAQLASVVICPLAVKAQWRAAGAAHVFHYEEMRTVAGYQRIRSALHAPSCLILDESHRIANPSTKTTRAAMRLARLARKRLCLTGTPTANSPADLWSQLRFLRPDAPLESRRQWQERYIECLPPFHPLMRQLRGNPFIPRKDRDGRLMLKNVDELAERLMAWGTTVRESEMADLPERTFVQRECAPSPMLRRAYQALRRDCVADLGTQALTAENAAVLALRLLRLASGLANDTEPAPPGLGNPKLTQLVQDLPTFLGEGRAIIWSVWRQEREALRRALTAAAVRWTDVVSEFLADETMMVLVGSPKQIGAGLNLQAATYQLWLSRTWSLIEREQALHRNYRIGQTKRTVVVDYVTAHTLEPSVMAVLEGKRDLLTCVMKGLTE